MLDVPLTEKGHPIAPSLQLCAKWCVDAGEEIPEDLVKKACGSARYEPAAKLNWRM